MTLHTNTHIAPLCILNYIQNLPLATQKLPSSVLHRKEISTFGQGYMHKHLHWRAQTNSDAVKENTGIQSLDRKVSVIVGINQIVNKRQEAYRSQTHSRGMSQLIPHVL